MFITIREKLLLSSSSPSWLHLGIIWGLLKKMLLPGSHPGVQPGPGLLGGLLKALLVVPVYSQH